MHSYRIKIQSFYPSLQIENPNIQDLKHSQTILLFTYCREKPIRT